jgi:hypothetical protein
MHEEYTGKYHHLPMVYFDNFIYKTDEDVFGKTDICLWDGPSREKSLPREFMNSESIKLKRIECRKLGHKDVTSMVQFYAV